MVTLRKIVRLPHTRFSHRWYGVINSILAIIFLTFPSLQWANGQAPKDAMPAISGEGFLSLPRQISSSLKGKVQIKNLAKQTLDFEIQSFDVLGQMIQVESLSVPAEETQALQIRSPSITTLVLNPTSKVPWSASLVFESGNAEISAFPLPKAKTALSLALGFSLKRDETAHVVMGSAQGLSWECSTEAQPSADETADAEVPPCSFLGSGPTSNTGDFQLRIKPTINDAAVMLYAIISKAGVVAKVIPAAFVAEESTDALASAPSCEAAKAAERAILISADLARQRAREAQEALERSRTAMSKSDFEGARDDAEKALREDPSSLCSRIYYTTILRALGKFEQLDRQLEILQNLAPSHATVLSLLGQRESEHHKYENALVDFKRALESSPGDCDILSNIASTLFNLKRPTSEIESYIQSPSQTCPWGFYYLALLKKDATDPFEFKSLLRTAAAFVKEHLSQNELALSDSTSQFTLAGIGANNYTLLASIYFELQEIDLAQGAIKKALQMAPFDPQLHDLASQINLSSKQFESALQHLDLTLRARSTNSNFHLKRGWILQSMKNFSDALDEYQKALDLDSANGQVYLNRGIIHFELQQLDEAESDFTAAKTFLPGNQWPQKNLEALEYRRKSAIPVQSTENGESPILNLADAADRASHNHSTIPQSVEIYLSTHRDQIKTVLQAADDTEQIGLALFLVSSSKNSFPELADLVNSYVSNADSQISRSAIAVVRKENDSRASPNLKLVAQQQAPGCASCAWDALAEIAPGDKEAQDSAIEGVLNQAKGLSEAMEYFLGEAACKDKTVLQRIKTAFERSNDPPILKVLGRIESATLAIKCQSVER